MSANNNIFTIKHNDLIPAKGSVLISEPFMQDIYFQRAVVLLLEHSTEGTMGIVLNKPTPLHVNDYFSGLKDVEDIPIYLGGPVHPEKLYFLHSLGELIPGSVLIKDNLYFGGDFDALQSYILQGFPFRDQVKFFVGYSGWESEQLQNEIKDNSWIVNHSTNHNIFNTIDDELFWKQELESMGDKYKTWTRFPKDPTMN